MAGLTSPSASQKRKAEQDIPLEAPTASTTSFGSVSTSGFGSPGVVRRRLREPVAEEDTVCEPFPVLCYHLQQCQQGSGTFNNITLQPADSSSSWQQLPATLLQYNQQQQGDQQMADSQPAQLTRANSAPELVKLTQAETAAWQQHPAAGMAGAHPSPALLSHKDYWVV